VNILIRGVNLDTLRTPPNLCDNDRLGKLISESGGISAMLKNLKLRSSTVIGTVFIAAMTSSGCFEGLKNNAVSEGASFKAPGSGGLSTYVYSFEDENINVWETFLGTVHSSTVNYRFSGQRGPIEGTSGDMSYRYLGYLVAPENGKYTLCPCAHDGIKISLDGVPVIDQFSNTNGARFWGSPALDLEKGEKKKLSVEYYNDGGDSIMELYWIRNDGELPWEQVCRHDDPDPAITELYECQTGVALNPALEIIPEGSLIPAGAELQAKAAACEIDNGMLPSGQLPTPGQFLTEARNLYLSLTGITPSTFSIRLNETARLLSEGRKIDAAQYVAQDPEFLNGPARSMANFMVTRYNSVTGPLNDAVVTMLGMINDRIDWRGLGSLPYNYMAKKDGSPATWGNELLYQRYATLASNLHYETIESSGVPLACALENVSRHNPSSFPAFMEQMLILPESGNDPESKTARTPNPDKAGILTSREFMKQNSTDGTNRRVIEKALQITTCLKIEDIKDISLPDIYVGRDVTRNPSGPGSRAEYETNCKGCHAGMDGLRAAAQKFDFDSDVVKYAAFFNTQENRRSLSSMTETDRTMKITPQLISTGSGPLANVMPNTNQVQTWWETTWKMAHNANVYPLGYEIKDHHWYNVLTNATGIQKFRWSQPYDQGDGMADFGRLLVNSGAFPECSARMVYKFYCDRAHDPFDPSMTPALANYVKSVGIAFSQGKFDMKALILSIALNCTTN